ncbi:MAG TPA: hypothetical protein VJK26_02535 [Patescibacteria group bacterium]|nr:hypothetical protein [Patescibacteria group bacterium]
MRQIDFPAILKGLIGAIGLLTIFFAISTWVSGFAFAKTQFFQYWYYLSGLALGFGIQIGLYSFLKNLGKRKDYSGKVLYVSGTTSTLSMISCCTHYLANFLPVIATSGVLSLVGQYQVKLFWIGIIFNIAAIIFIFSRLRKFLRRTKLKEVI